jgi:mono/diheme cytochrome c family protein
MSVPFAAGPLQQAGRLPEGEELFKGHCASCHGLTGKGDGPAAPALKTAPSDLTSITRRNGGTFPAARLVRFIEEGAPNVTAHGSKEMPVWGPIFSGLAISSYKPTGLRVEDVVAYLESIQSR